jgi:type II secretory pathway pseudopilin PulG
LLKRGGFAQNGKREWLWLDRSHFILRQGLDMGRQKKAFTLIEAILIVLFLGIVAVIAVPRFSFSAQSKQKAKSLAKKIVTDLRRTRMLAISNAATNSTGFTLKMTGSAPYSNYQITDDSSTPGTVVDSQTIDSQVSVSCAGSGLFSFGPSGSVRSGSDVRITVSASGKTFTINITSATGMVKCTEN